MKLTLSGRPVGLKIDKDGNRFLMLEPSKDAVDLQDVVLFVKRTCDIRMLSSKKDVNIKGHIEEMNLKNKLKLKVVCSDETLDLNAINQLIDDPETTSIIFNDGQSTLIDFKERKKTPAVG